MTSTPDAPQQVVILVGGLGTRLGSLTSETPKPLLDIAGRPFLDYLIEKAIRFGFSHFLLLAGRGIDFLAEHYSQKVARNLLARDMPELVCDS